MLWGIIFSVLTGLAWAGVGVVTSQIVRREFDYVAYGIQSCLLAGLGAALFLTRWQVVRAGAPPRCLELVLVLAGSGFLQALGFWWMQRAMREGPHALIWTLGQMALVVPFLVNVLFWREALPVHRFAGLLLVAAGVFLLGKSKDDAPGPSSARPAWVIPAFFSFACIGVSQALCTWPSHWPNWEDSAGLRVPVILGATGLGYLGLRRISPVRSRDASWRFSVVGAAATLVGAFLLFIAIDRLATSRMIALAYPLAVGVCIVFFSLYGRLVLAESQSPLGLVATVAGLIALSI